MTKKRKKTELGRTLAKIRIDFDETGADMAEKLGISSSQMFNIEVGLAQIGYEFIGKIKEIYSVDLADIMKRGGFMSKITLDLDDLSQEDKTTVLDIWSKKWEDEPHEQPTASVAEAEAVKPKPQVGPRVVTDKPTKRSKPRTNKANDGIGWLDADGAGDAELDGIDEATAL